MIIVIIIMIILISFVNSYKTSSSYKVLRSSGIVKMLASSSSSKYTLDETTMLRLLDRIKENNNINSNNLTTDYVKWMINNKVYGYLKPNFAIEISKYDDVFTYNKNNNTVSFTSDVEQLSVNDKSAVVGKVTLDLKNKNVITGWRSELLPVVSTFSEKPVLLLERAAYPLFGMKGYGVHVNGFVRNEHTKDIESLWVATRSPTKSTWPSMLDHIVAGGQPYGISPSENVIKGNNLSFAFFYNISNKYTTNYP